MLMLGLGAVSSVPSAFPDEWMRGAVFFLNSQKDVAVNTTLSALGSARAELGVDTVAIQYMWAAANGTSSSVFADDRTQLAADLETLINAAHGHGLQVLLKPMVVAVNSTTSPRGELVPRLHPTDAAAWFASYEQLLIPTASMAERLGVKALAVGLELEALVSHEASWRALIHKVRGLFKGQLTYSSNPLVNETSSVAFWDAVDYIGAELYLPFVLDPSPNASLILSRAQMVATYSLLLRHFLLDWHAALWPKRKILVTEFGYPSSNIGMRIPWSNPDGHPGSRPLPASCTGVHASNLTAQAAAYDVALSAFAANPTVFNGAFQLWYGTPGTSDWIGDREKPGSLWACGWTPACKSGTVSALRRAFAKTT